jgi:hypothetical protein
MYLDIIMNSVKHSRDFLIGANMSHLEATVGWVCNYDLGAGAERKCACLQIFSGGKPSGKLPLGILKRRREHNFKIDFREKWDVRMEVG